LELVAKGLAELGRVTIAVSGDSMLPTLRPGERVVLHAIEPDAVKPQDVIAYRLSTGYLVLHRVHAIRGDHLVTAGDHHALLDPRVPKADVLGIAHGIAPRPAPRPWPAGPSRDVDVWLVGPDPALSIMDSVAVPATWRLHRRPAEGVGVPAAVLAEIRAAVDGRPCVGVSEHAVHAASDVVGRGLPPGTQVLIGCSFGRLDQPMPGHLIPSETAGVHVRVGPPAVPLSAARTLRRLVTLLSPSDSPS
jgi:hypothetical protein